MKFEDKNIYENKRRFFIETLVNAASSNAVPLDIFHKYNQIFRKNELSEEEKDICNKVELATVHTKNLGDFRFAMEEIWDKEDVLNILEHENAHANVAQSLGVETKDYRLIFYKNEKGNILIEPSVRISLTGTLEERNQKKIKILLAPHEYGNILSDEDTNTLQYILNN